MPINYIKGDATTPIGDGNKVIVHCCNNIGAWGAGFVLALSKKWPEPEARYRAKDRFTLGTIQNIQVEPNTWVCNLIGQQGVGSDKNGRSPIRYDAIEQGLRTLGNAIVENKRGLSVHCPRFGAGLAGGDWQIIEAIIKSTLVDRGIEVTVYDFN